MTDTGRTNTVAVIPGRFHVPELHPGHVDLFETAFAECDEVLVLLGTPYTTSENDPLNFILRKMMIEGRFPGRNLRILESPSLPSSNEYRSAILDEIIERECAEAIVTVYGSSDSIVHKYTGRYPTRETPTITTTRGTDIRKAIVPKDSEEFREGAMYAIIDRKPMPYPSVDIAPISGNLGQVLLVGKPEGEGKLQFAGVFYDPLVDNSFEDAANRCVQKELAGIDVGIPVPIGSRKIFDPRLKRTRDGVISTLMRMSSSGGTPALEKGIERAVWVPMWFDKVPEFIIDMHKPLAELIMRRWNGN